jgi:pyruvate dehydrogenase E1 component alpha subunit
MNGRGQLSATFFGDGATNIGAFHEAMNIAQVWKLPVLFICENNLYGEFTRINHTTPYEDLIRRAEGYAMANVQVDGNDVEAVYAATAEAANRARSGGGPTFIECMTYRHRGHSRTDPAKYRDPKEVEAWLARDPLKLYEAALIKRKVLTKAKAEEMIAEERARQRAASERAAKAPWPEADRMDYQTLTFA